MISSIAWVPRGAANPNPPRYQVGLEEVEALKERAEALGGDAPVDVEDDDVEEDGNASEAEAAEAVAELLEAGEAEEGEGSEGEGESSGKLDRHGLPVELRMDDYDEEEEGQETAAFIHADEDEEEGSEQEMDEMMDEEEEEDEEDEEEDEEEGDGDLAGAAPASEFMRLGEEEEGSDGEDSDAEDYQIRPTDAVVLVANTEDEEHSALEVHVYEEDTGSLYIHHDIALPAFPLALAWGDCHPALGHEGGRGSYVAVGTFRPGIEIWDLDVIDPLEPSRILGGERALHHDLMAAEEAAEGESLSKKKGKKGKKGKKKRRGNEDELVEGSHEGPVMSLAWNAIHRQVLASGSADSTVKLWDVTTGQCSATLTHHSDKVNSLQWHPVEGTVLATAGFDRGVKVLDARDPTNTACALAVQADPECVGWAPHAPSLLLCSSDDGSLRAWDVRNPKAPLWALKAHAKTCSAFAFSPLAPGLLATAGLDKIVKLWDCKSNPAAAPVALGEKAMAVGKLFALSFYTSSPFLLAAGGDKGLLALWDLHEVDAVTRRFDAVNAAQDEARGEAAAAMMEGMTLAATDDREPPKGKVEKGEGKSGGGKGKGKGGGKASQKGGKKK